MAIPAPPPFEHENPFLVVASDLRKQRGSEVPYPPGLTDYSIARTMRFAEDPLPILLDSYEKFGPVFTLRIFHGLLVFALGPEANHYITVSHADNFLWRESHFRDLTALIGDGLLTTDGEFHRRSRLIMLPAFHRDQIEASAAAINEETERALEQLHIGSRLDLYHWTRRLALRIAMKALFGLDPDSGRAKQIDAAGMFEQALSFYATAYPMRMLRGPGSPWSRLMTASRRLNDMIYEEIRERRENGERGEDVMSLLLDATDEEGLALSNSQIRDEVMTLLFAGHDTTTSTISFMFHELAKDRAVTEELVREQDEVLGGRQLSASELMGDALPKLEMAMEETLRMYPPAWIGPRRSVKPFELEGVMVPGEAYVNYSSWASHHLQDVWEQPEVFKPSRFTPEAKAMLPKGAYIPFGGGSRTCIGMRFGQLEVRCIATAILRNFSLELEDGFELSIRQMPTISPRRGLPMVVGERAGLGRPTAVAP
ncbi:MAG TPA: cytochrome P450 [Solirubrobacteraceae bacterium]|jgi:cytochrome P450